MNLNKVFLIGRLTRDPEKRALPSGRSVTSFGRATGRLYTDKNVQKQEQTEFHNIVMFGKLADISAQYLNKGSLTFIEGRLQTRTWQDSSGNQKSRTEIVAERMQLGPRSAARTSQDAEKISEDIPVVEEDQIDIKDIPF